MAVIFASRLYLIILKALCPSGLFPHAPEVVSCFLFLAHVYVTILPHDLPFPFFPLTLASFCLHFDFMVLF